MWKTTVCENQAHDQTYPPGSEEANRTRKDSVAESEVSVRKLTKLEIVKILGPERKRRLIVQNAVATGNDRPTHAEAKQ